MGDSGSWTPRAAFPLPPFPPSPGSAGAPGGSGEPCPGDPRCGAVRCVAQVNGLDTVRVPMAVVQFLRPRTRRYKHWLAQQQALLAASRQQHL